MEIDVAKKDEIVELITIGTIESVGFPREEEIELIQEEMRQKIVYYEWKASHLTTDNLILHRITAYAQKQEYYCKCLVALLAITRNISRMGT